MTKLLKFLAAPLLGEAALMVYNISGKRVHTEQTQGAFLDSPILNLSHLPEGAYILEVVTESDKLQQKLLIRR